MKKDIHPVYGPVAFRDRSTGKIFVTRSTLAASPGARRIDVDGAPCPVVDVDVSSDSHPFWTGRGHTLDTEGRVEAFRRRYGQAPGRGSTQKSSAAASAEQRTAQRDPGDLS